MGRLTKTYPKFARHLKTYLEKKYPKEHSAYSWLAALVSVERQTVQRWIEDASRPKDALIIIRIGKHLDLNKEECIALLKAAERSPYTLEEQQEELSREKNRLIAKKKLTDEEGKKIANIDEALDYIKEQLRGSVQTTSADLSFAAFDIQRLASLETKVQELSQQQSPQDLSQLQHGEAEVELPHTNEYPAVRKLKTEELSDNNESGDISVKPRINEPRNSNVATIKVLFAIDEDMSSSQIYLDDELIETVLGTDNEIKSVIFTAMPGHHTIKAEAYGRSHLALIHDKLSFIYGDGSCYMMSETSKDFLAGHTYEFLVTYIRGVVDLFYMTKGTFSFFSKKKRYRRHAYIRQLKSYLTEPE